VFLYAFDLLELDGVDLRPEPIETRKATLSSLLRGSLPGLRVNEHLIRSGRWSTATPAEWGSKASCQSDWARAILRAAPATG
jgi:ATP-dependent DNA ligase